MVFTLLLDGECPQWLTVDLYLFVPTGSITAKLVFPQDPMVGWIVRGVPLLTVPLHAVFLLVIGQMFADWWICAACICFMIGDGALTWFGQNIPRSYTTWEGPKKQIGIAKKKGLAFSVLGLVFLLIGLAYNDLLPELSLSVKLDFRRVMNLLHTVALFVFKFIISKTLVTTIFCDFIIDMVFCVNDELQNRNLQDPYQREVRVIADVHYSSGCFQFSGSLNFDGITVVCMAGYYSSDVSPWI
jgi:hypothetical protein